MADTSELINEGIDRLSERRRRLFAVACVRQIWNIVVERSCKAVEVAERYADGLDTEAQLREAREGARDAAQLREARDADADVALGAAAHAATVQGAAWEAAWEAAHAAAAWAVATTVQNAREIWDVWDVTWEKARAGQLALLRTEFLPPDPLPSIDPAWLTCTVMKVAVVIYQEKRFQDTPILADALEEAGCTAVSVLEHLRSADHVRGCWAVDLLLGKE